MKKKPTVHNSIGPVIVDLIEELEIQLDQELCSYYSNTDSSKSKPALPATAPAKTFATNEKTETTTKSTSAGTMSIQKTKSPTNISVIETKFILFCRKYQHPQLVIFTFRYNLTEQSS